MKNHNVMQPTQGKNALKKSRKQILDRYQKNDFKEAETKAERYLKKQQDDAAIWQILGVCQRNLGKSQSAIKSLRKANSLSPDSVPILNSLLSVLTGPKQGQEYFDVVKKLYQLDATNETICVDSIRRLHQLGNTGESLDWCNKFVEAFPESAVLNFYLSLALKNVGKLPESIETGRRSLELRQQQPTSVKQQQEKAAFNSAENKQLLWQVLAELKKQNTHAFPTAGTLLGLIREGDLLKGDKDVDLAIPYEEIDDAVKILQDMGWKEVKGSYVLINPRQMHHPQHHLTIDLCGLLKEKESGIIIGGFWMPDIPKEWNRITEFPTMKLNAMHTEYGEVWWPAEPEAWLEKLYGDWRTPDHEFDTTVSAANLRGFSLLVECYAIQRTFFNWNEGDLSRALKIIRSTLKHKPNDQLFNKLLIELSEHLEK